jgi:hypothetical protein
MHWWALIHIFIQKLMLYGACLFQFQNYFFCIFENKFCKVVFQNITSSFIFVFLN